MSYIWLCGMGNYFIYLCTWHIFLWLFNIFHYLCSLLLCTIDAFPLLVQQKKKKRKIHGFSKQNRYKIKKGIAAWLLSQWRMQAFYSGQSVHVHVYGLASCCSFKASPENKQLPEQQAVKKSHITSLFQNNHSYWLNILFQILRCYFII